jgi:hypothetical protein
MYMTCEISYIFIVAGIYYFVYLRQRQSTHWVMLAPTQSDEAEAAAAGLDASAGN